MDMRSTFGAGLAAKVYRRLTRKRSRPSADVWNDEYNSGQWQHLWSDDELPRYAIISSYLQQRCPGGALLDLGCGEGVLCSRLYPGSHTHYLGVDLSASAVARARTGAEPNVEYVCADVESYQPEASFDAIIFNEVLYYFADPAQVVMRYRPSLAPNGVMLASLFVPSLKTIRGAVNKIDALAVWKRQFLVSNEPSGNAWVIKVWGFDKGRVSQD